MISTQEFDVSSTKIDITNVTKILIKQAFETDTPVTCYRELQVIDEQGRSVMLHMYAESLDKLAIVEEKINRHKWKYACNTPAGGLDGDEEIYVCIHCGKETNNTDKESLYCPTPDDDVQCPDCKPHPRHEMGKCKFSCGCKTHSRPEGANK